MSNQDPISNMLVSIYNAQRVNKISLEVYFSKIKLKILKIFKKEGFIENLILNKKKIIIFLKYFNNKPVIEKIKRVSKPSLRVYVNKNNIPKILGGLGTFIISTSCGLMTDKIARIKGYGGEVICYIY